MSEYDTLYILLVKGLIERSYISGYEVDREFAKELIESYELEI